MTELDRWPPDRLAAWQADRLREILDYAATESAFYRALWAAAQTAPEDVRSLADLERLPVVSKRDLLAAGEEWLASGRGPVGFSTRGTSGEPLVLWMDAAESEAYIVPTIRGFRWAGVGDGTTALLLSPAWHRLAAMEGHAVVRLGGRAAYFWGTLGGSEHVDAFLEALEEVRPRFVTSTPPFLLGALRRLDETGRDPLARFDSVNAISLVGLPLTPQLEELLRTRLGLAHVFERGGTQEGAALDECELHTTPHIHADVCHLEVLDPDGRAVAPGSRGRLVVTKLVAGGSPFVRYDTGDIAAFEPEPCPCGRTLPRLRIFGRRESSVEVGGRLVTAYDVRRCVDEDPELVGRVVLLVRSSEPGPVRVAIEGRPGDESGLLGRLHDRLEVEDAEILWLGDTRVFWGLRQVIDEAELRGGRP